jgi:hypothetical protein
MRGTMFPNIKPELLPQWRIDEAISEKRIAIAKLEAQLAELKRKLAYLESLKQS